MRTARPDSGLTLLIGGDALLRAWAKYASMAPAVIPLLCTDLERALDSIELAEAKVIVFEQALGATETGSALMRRIHNERSWRGTEIRLLPSEQASRIVATDPGGLHPQEWLIAHSLPLPPRPERRASRIPAEGNEQTFIDGDAVTLVDVSATGAQVRSPAVLRPHRHVRVAMTKGDTSVKTRAVVVWSMFEMAPVAGYRAGIAFARPLPELVAPATEDIPSAGFTAARAPLPQPSGAVQREATR